jgi:uncharacterized protein (TIGR01244 family)
MKRTFSTGWLALVALLLFSGACAAQEPAAEHPANEAVPAPIRPARLGSIQKVHICGTLYLASQFSAEDLNAIRAVGIRRVISLRTAEELQWDEQAAVEAAGLAFVAVPVRDAAALGDAEFDRVRDLLAQMDEPTLLHCDTSDRVGAVWLSWRVLDEGVPLETAVAQAKIAGLRSDDLLDKALRYIRRKQNARDVPDEGEDDGALD